MYGLIKNTIEQGIVPFSDIQNRIKKLYASGSFTDAQFDELMSFAAEKANPETERPELMSMIQMLYVQVTDLKARVKVLEGGTDEGDSAKYPTWTPWDGLSQDYQTGAIVEHKGQLWQSTYSGQNVWEPGTVDDRFWVKYSPEA